MPRTTDPAPTDLLRIDDELTDDERLVRDTVRKFAADQIMPNIADWFEAGTVPKELFPELGQLGLLGMHLTGYGCAGMGAVAYGVACRELEAADSGLRSMVSVQGSLAMFPIWKYGSEEQKDEWLPRMSAGQADRLLRPDRAGPRQRSLRHETHAKRNGADWILSGSKMWITNGGIADIAVVWAGTDRWHPRLPGAPRRPRVQHAEHPQETVAARLGHLGAALSTTCGCPVAPCCPACRDLRDHCPACRRPGSASCGA